MWSCPATAEPPETITEPGSRRRAVCLVETPAGYANLCRLLTRRHRAAAFDLAGAEAGQPAARHREAFYHVMNNNLPATVHAGETFGPESIHMAIHRCGAKRIGHGTRLEEDPDLMDFVTDHRIPLEICLSSSLAAGAVLLEIEAAGD